MTMLELTEADRANLQRLRKLATEGNDLCRRLIAATVSALRGRDRPAERERIGARLQEVYTECDSIPLTPLDHHYCKTAGVQPTELVGDYTTEPFRLGRRRRVIDVREDGTICFADGETLNPEAKRRMN